MGQFASKAASKIMTRSAKAPPPKPSDVHGGFTRGATLDPRDQRQAEYLRQQQALHSGGSDSTELTPELLAFLKAAGPLRVPPTATVQQQQNQRPPPKRTRQSSLLQSEDPVESKDSINNTNETTEAIDHRPSQFPRERETMRLAENIEGFETTRNTSFSHKAEPVNPRDFDAGDVLDMYTLLQRYETLGNPEAAVASFYKEHNDRRATPWSTQDAEHHQALLRNTIRYVQVPVILMDTDQSFIGAPREAVEDLKRMKLVEVPKTKVKLVLEDLWEQNKQR
jgi:hypothetical protein